MNPDLTCYHNSPLHLKNVSTFSNYKPKKYKNKKNKNVSLKNFFQSRADADQA